MKQVRLQKDWLRQGFVHPDGMVPLVTPEGGLIEAALVEQALLNGWVELLPLASGGGYSIGCRLTSVGRHFAKSSSAHPAVGTAPTNPRGGARKAPTKSAALLTKMLRLAEFDGAPPAAATPRARRMNVLLLLSLVLAAVLSVYTLRPLLSGSEPVSDAVVSAQSAPPVEEQLPVAGEPTALAAQSGEPPRTGAEPKPRASGAPDGYWQNIVHLMMNERSAQAVASSGAETAPASTVETMAAPSKGGETQAVDARADQDGAVPALVAKTVAEGGVDIPPPTVAAGGDKTASTALVLAESKEEEEPEPQPQERAVYTASSEDASGEGSNVPLSMETASLSLDGGTTNVPSASPAPVAPVEPSPAEPDPAVPDPAAQETAQDRATAGTGPKGSSAASEMASEFPLPQSGDDTPSNVGQQEMAAAASHEDSPPPAPQGDLPEIDAESPPPLAAEAIVAAEAKGLPLLSESSRSDEAAQPDETQQAEAAPPAPENPLPVNTMTGKGELKEVLEIRPAAERAETATLLPDQSEEPAVESQQQSSIHPSPGPGESQLSMLTTPRAAPSSRDAETASQAASPAKSSSKPLKQAAQPEAPAPEAEPETPSLGAHEEATEQAAEQTDPIPGVLPAQDAQLATTSAHTAPPQTAAGSPDAGAKPGAPRAERHLDGVDPLTEAPSPPQPAERATDTDDLTIPTNQAPAAPIGDEGSFRQVQIAVLPPLKPAQPREVSEAALIAARPAATPSVKTGPQTGFTVQFASLDSEKAALRVAATLTEELGGLLGTNSLFVVQAEVSGRTYYRVRVNAEMAKADASTLCRESQQRNQDCFVSSNGG